MLKDLQKLNHTVNKLYSKCDVNKFLQSYLLIQTLLFWGDFLSFRKRANSQDRKKIPLFFPKGKNN